MRSSSADLTEGKEGVLYVVATPLGNLEDITIRAINILKSSDIVAAEDTRHTKILLQKYDIRTKLVSCHEHNENQKSDYLVEKLISGKTIALVSDAGTPTVSDPGFILIKTALQSKIKVIPIPGPSAVVSALSVAGIPTDSFVFFGFLPKKKKSRNEVFNQIAGSKKTSVFYESPRRITLLIKEIIEKTGDRQAMLAREMTKVYEEYIHGMLSEILDALEEKKAIKGECTLIVSGSSLAAEDNDEAIVLGIKECLKEGVLKTSQIARKLSEKYSVPKKKVYDLVLKIKEE